ncbi:hypothetical protein [Amycolatopsis magusensis]|uniref:hypothetical protein n=1 Tax=Amycolatopsis magusensis TaxID=882444 RepID=UPI003C2B9CB7
MGFEAVRADLDPTTYLNPLTETAPGDLELDAKIGDSWGNGNTCPGVTLPHGMDVSAIGVGG